MTIPDEVVANAGSFTRAILGNRFTTKAGMKDIEAILEDQFRVRKQAADADSRAGTNRDEYLFFQGAQMGMLLAYKQVKQHYLATALDQNMNPETGQVLKGGTS